MDPSDRLLESYIRRAIRILRLPSHASSSVAFAVELLNDALRQSGLVPEVVEPEVTE